MFLAFSGLFLWVGCGGGGSSSTSTTATQLRFLQGSPDSPNVNLLIDGASVASNLTYGNSTGYVAVKAGSRHIQVQQVNTTTNLLDQTVPVSSGASQTLFMTGPKAGIKALTLTDGGTTAVGTDGYVRVINASSNLGTIDVYIVTAGTSLAGLKPTVAAVAFDGDTGYQQVAGGGGSAGATGNYQVYLTAQGTTNVLLSIGPVSFTSNQDQTVIALDNPAGGSTYSILIDQ